MGIINNFFKTHFSTHLLYQFYVIYQNMHCSQLHQKTRQFFKTSVLNRIRLNRLNNVLSAPSNPRRIFQKKKIWHPENKQWEWSKYNFLFFFKPYTSFILYNIRHQCQNMRISAKIHIWIPFESNKVKFNPLYRGVPLKNYLEMPS